MKKTRTERRGVQSVEVGLKLLRVLVDHGRPMMLRDIASGGAMPAAKAHRYLASFARAGYVEQDQGSGLYDLGPYALEFSLSCLGRLDSVRRATALLPELCERFQQTVLLAVWANRGPTVVRMEEPSDPATVNIRVGSVFPLLTSATGRTFAGFAPEAWTRPLIAAEVRANARAKETRGPRSTAEAERVLAEVRGHGLGRVTGELVPGIHSLAAPVFDHAGRMVLALTVLGYSDRIDVSWDGSVARALRVTAAGLSRRLGYREGGEA